MATASQLLSGKLADFTSFNGGVSLANTSQGIQTSYQNNSKGKASLLSMSGNPVDFTLFNGGETLANTCQCIQTSASCLQPSTLQQMSRAGTPVGFNSCSLPSTQPGKGKGGVTCANPKVIRRSASYQNPMATTQRLSMSGNPVDFTTSFNGGVTSANTAQGIQMSANYQNPAKGKANFREVGIWPSTHDDIDRSAAASRYSANDFFEGDDLAHATGRPQSGSLADFTAFNGGVTSANIYGRPVAASSAAEEVYDAMRNKGDGLAHATWRPQSEYSDQPWYGREYCKNYPKSDYPKYQNPPLTRILSKRRLKTGAMISIRT